MIIQGLKEMISGQSSKPLACASVNTDVSVK